MTFIPEYAAYLINKSSKDGKRNYERVKAERPTLGVALGEKELYKVELNNHMEKINARWEFGIFVGVRRRSNELWIATQDQIISVPAVKRIPIEQRWSEDCITWAKDVPWNRYKDGADADGDLPEEVPAPSANFNRPS